MYSIKSLMENASISRDATVLIHSAFKGLSKKNVNPLIFMDELVNYFSVDANILMPAMSWRICTPLNPYFDVNKTPGNVGYLAEVFRTKYSSYRSLHPTHSVSGRGPLAYMYLYEHHKNKTPCSEVSPFKKIAENGGLIFMLGVGLECCTLFHCAEEMIARDLYLMPETEEYLCSDFESIIHKVQIHRHQKKIRDYNKLKTILKNEGALVDGVFRGQKWLCINAKKSLSIACELLKTDQTFLFKNELE